MTFPRRTRLYAPSLAAVLAIGLVVTGASTASAVTPIDGTLPLDLVEGSRLFGIEQYHPAVYEITAGPRNTTLVAPSAFSVQYNLGATYDPDSGKVFYLTGSLTGCALYSFDPDTSTASIVATIADGPNLLTGCWGLTTLGGGTALLAAGSTIYDYNLVTRTLSTPRSNPCRGNSLAFDPSTGDLYSGKNNGELYRLSVTDSSVTCTLVTTLVDVVDGTGENLKGFTFDSDGTLFFLSRWAPKLYSLTPADLTAPVNYYGDLRFTPADPELPIDSLAMVYAPLSDEASQSGASQELPNTGTSPSSLLFGACALITAGFVAFVLRLGRRARHPA